MIRRATRLLCCLLLLLPVAAVAQPARGTAPPRDPLFDDRLSVTVGVGAAWPETLVRYDASDGTRGTPLEAENDLGFDERETVTRLDVALRPRARHRLRLGLVALPDPRRATTVIAEDIRFGDDVYFAGDTVKSTLRLRAWSASYGYSFVRSPRLEIGASLGVTSLGLLAEAGVPARGLREREERTELVPQGGVDAAYRFGPRWHGEARYQYFELSGDDARGRLTQAEAAVMFQINPHLAAGLSYTDFDASVDLREPGDSARYRQRSGSVMLVVRAGL